MDGFPVTAPPAGFPLTWDTHAGQRQHGGRVRYRGPLTHADRPLHLHLGFDGAATPFRDVPLERDGDGSWTGEIAGSGSSILLDAAVVTDDEQWDNNDGADYRLWFDLDPVDAHVHARTPGLDPMGFESLRVALASGGMTHALVSWQDNEFVDRVTGGVPWLSKLVWVSPGGPDPDDVARRLAAGAVGLKLHPTHDRYPADAPGLDPFLTVAAEAGVPVTVHTAPGPSDPDLVARLAERFPQVPFVLYHTFLGPPSGRRRAARHAQRLPNLYLETSWCRSREVRRLIDAVGPNRVLFGSDAATDGPVHFVRSPPNVEMVETYNQGLLTLARRLPAATLRALLEGNTRRLFRLPEAGLPLRTDDMLELFGAAVEQAERVVAEVRPDQFSQATPCAGWDVQALLGHLLSGLRRAERIARGRSVSTVPVVTAADTRRRWPARFGAAATTAQRAWQQHTPRAVAVPWGAVPAPVALSGLVLEIVAHTHDLAVATGVQALLDDQLAVAALAIAERLVPDDLRADSDDFARSVPAPPGAAPYARLAAFLGRPVR